MTKRNVYRAFILDSCLILCVLLTASCNGIGNKDDAKSGDKSAANATSSISISGNAPVSGQGRTAPDPANGPAGGAADQCGNFGYVFGTNWVPGTISSDIPIHMKLQRNGDSVSGQYYYDKVKLPLRLNGQLQGCGLNLTEYDGNGKITGMFSGKLYSYNGLTYFDGKWDASDGSKSFPFHFGGEQVISSEDTFGGKYKRRNKDGVDGDMVLKHLSGNKYHFNFNAWNGQGHLGELEGDAVLDGDTLTYDGSNTDSVCQLTAVFSGKIAVVTNSCTDCCGMNIILDGTYAKVM